MTLDAADAQQVIELAARTCAEMIRNANRGTGGATARVGTTRLGTVSGDANNGDEVFVRADGDMNAVPAVNVTGVPVRAGERVVIEWPPPSGVYITHIVGRSRQGLWTPVWTGTGGASGGNSALTGSYYRIGDLCHVRGKMVHGSIANTGTTLQMGGLPFPIATQGDPGMYYVGNAYYWSGTRNFPGQAIAAPGSSTLTLEAFTVFATPGYAYSTDVGSGVPFAWGNGCEVNVEISYITDAG